MMITRTSLTEQIRQQVRFIPLPIDESVVHCLAGHLLPVGTVKTIWVAPTLEDLERKSLVPPARVCEASRSMLDQANP